MQTKTEIEPNQIINNLSKLHEITQTSGTNSLVEETNNVPPQVITPEIKTLENESEKNSKYEEKGVKLEIALDENEKLEFSDDEEDEESD